MNDDRTKETPHSPRKPQAEKKTSRAEFFARLLFILSILLLLVLSHRLWQIHEMYQLGEQTYDALATQIHQTEAEEDNHNQSQPPAVDIGALQAVSADAIGWLYSPDTPIDYPVMRAEAYDQYLHHLPDGTYNESGTPFLDSHHAPDLNGKLSVIYGREAPGDQMFSSLLHYKTQAYYEAHPDLRLYTKQGSYTIELLYGYTIEPGQWRERAFMFEANRAALLDYAAAHTTFERPAARTEGDSLEGERLMVLATSNRRFDTGGYLVIGILRPLYPDRDNRPLPF